MGTFRFSKACSTLCIRFCSFLHFYVTLTLSVKFAGIGLAEVVTVIVAISKCHFHQYILICPDEGFNAETLRERETESERHIYIYHNSIVVGISTLNVVL